MLHDQCVLSEGLAHLHSFPIGLQVSRALSQAFEAIEAQAAAELSGRSAKDIVDSLHHQIKEIYFPPKVWHGKDGD